jgi:hypothetical protein
MAAVAAEGILYLPVGAHQRLYLFALTHFLIEQETGPLGSAL